VKQRAPLGGRVFYVGLHGLEVEGPGIAVAQRDVIDDCRNQVHEIAATLEPSMSPLPGVRLEDNEAAIAVHTREASSSDAVWARFRLLSTAAAVAGHNALRAVRGNHVIELLPNVPSPRGAAIGRIRKYLWEQTARPVFTLYIGEDVPDDDAFDAVAGRGISAAVGGRARKARFHLASTSDVWRLIERLVACRTTSWAL
jgi:trehalose-phosphatase